MTYDAVVFDNDGVLVGMTGQEVVWNAARKAFQDLGVEEPDDDVIQRMYSTNSVEDLRALAAEHGLDAAELWERREQNAIDAQRELIREGGKPLYDDFEALRSLDVEMAVVSNNQQQTIETILAHNDIADLFVTYSGREPTLEGVRRKKPDPYYLERALEKLDAEDVLYVGDSNVDIEAAAAAGVDSAYVSRGHREGYELRSEPTERLDSLWELKDLVNGHAET